MPISSYVRQPSAPQVIANGECRWLVSGDELTIALSVGEVRTFIAQWRQALDDLEASLPAQPPMRFYTTTGKLDREPSDAA